MEKESPIWSVLSALVPRKFVPVSVTVVTPQGDQKSIDLSKVDVSMNGIELQDREFVAAANAAIDHVHDWVLGTPDGDWVSMAIPSDGSYGVEEGLISGAACECSGGEWKRVEGLEITDFSRGRIDATVAELKEERDAVKDLGLI